MVDPVWAGVVGALGGAAVGALTSLAAPLINWRVERKRTAEQWQRTTIREWREGLATATKAYNDWDQNPSEHPLPAVAGTVWFESLRPHLSEDCRASYIEGSYDESRQLADEIARIERKWKLVR